MINFAWLNKDGEQFIFVFDEANRESAIQVACSFAVNPELNFTWTDAAEVAAKIRSFPKGINHAV